MQAQDIFWKKEVARSNRDVIARFFKGMECILGTGKWRRV